jgi:DNA-binding beta-propeller fold protein YncE
MKIHNLILLAVFAQSSLAAFTASAHPGSGIVVDQQGQVFFGDISRGLLKIDPQGKVTTVFPREGGHWLALDANGSFSTVDFEKSPHWPRWFKRRTPAGVRPALITDGGSPLVVAPDGNLYYVCNDERMIPGGLLIAQLTPDGKETLLSPAFRGTSDELGGIKGLAVGPDGSLYASYPKAILKFTLAGKISTILNPVVVPDCEKKSPSVEDAPSLRGLVVDERGVVYVAATGCRCVIKITPDSHVETILKAEPPWSPTGLALKEGDIFVLEYTVLNEAAHDYLPRVRKLGQDGKVTTLTTFAPERR